MKIVIWQIDDSRDKQIYQGSLGQAIDAVNTSLLTLG